MSLIDKASSESQALRQLIIGSRQDEIDLTRQDSPFVISHKPNSCSECTEWYKEVREIGSAHPDLFDRVGYVKGPAFSSLEIGQQRRLQEIGELVEKHLEKVHNGEFARLTKEASEGDRFEWG